MTIIARASRQELTTVLVLVERLLSELGASVSFDGVDLDDVRSHLLDAGDRFVAFLAIDAAGTPVTNRSATR